MAVNEYICLNGNFLKTSEPSIFSDNRAFRYGDSLVENIHAYATEPQFLSLHLRRLSANMQTLAMLVPAFFTVANMNDLIVRLLNKNRIFGSAGIRLTVFRNPEYDVIPKKNEVSFLIESSVIGPGKYNLNDKGLVIDICTSLTKTADPLAGIYRANSLLFMMGAMKCSNDHLDDYILLNQNGRIVETTNSNIFLVSGKSIFTPGSDQGCIPGIMRSVIIDLAAKLGLIVNDQSSLTPAALDDAEEVFLTNAINGIRWVGSYRQTRYFNKTAKLFTAKLNELAFKP